MTIPTILQTSEGTGKLSLTVQGAAVLIITMTLAHYGITTENGDILAFVNAFVTIGSAGVTIWGLIRKYLNAVK